jgi:hypothetical protein
MERKMESTNKKTRQGRKSENGFFTKSLSQERMGSLPYAVPQFLYRNRDDVRSRTIILPFKQTTIWIPATEHESENPPARFAGWRSTAKTECCK